MASERLLCCTRQVLLTADEGLRAKKKIKLKSHSGAKKRFKLRADGKFMHAWCGKSHLNTGTHSRMRRRKKGMKLVASLGIQRRLRKLLPYGGI